MKLKVYFYLAVTASVLIVTAQNCSPGFKNTAATGSETALDSQNHSGPHVFLQTSSLGLGQDLSFKVYQESVPSNVQYQWSYSINGAASGCLLRTTNSSTQFIINCSQSGSLVVSVKLRSGQVTIPVQAYQGLLKSSTQSSTVNFSIRSGTGTSAWNSNSTMVEVFVGQTLVIRNEDSVNHQLHTGGKPCGHGSAIAPGATANCVIGAAYNPSVDSAIYDHNVGPSAQFFLTAYDGGAIYNTQCMSCHGALASSTKRNALASEIANAILNIDTMKNRAGLIALTPKQIEAIAYSLSH